MGTISDPPFDVSIGENEGLSKAVLRYLKRQSAKWLVTRCRFSP
jgi:hypothetical protein